MKAGVAALLVCLATTPVLAADRYAIVIGVNAGDPDVPVLRYAERDAERMGEVLVRLGDVAPERLTLARPRSASELRHALTTFADQVRQSEDALVVAYYSGHADATSLQIGGTRLAFGDLKQLLRATNAQLTIVVVDACRSAGLITAKGGTPTAPFDLGLATPDVEGLAIVTSSSASEDAQESEHLQGGVFTHHLLTGLMGAADATGDGQVSLTEVYRHAYLQTLATTLGTAIEQHPAFAFDLRGEDDILLTRFGAVAERGLVELVGRGRWLVFDGARLVSEVEVKKRARLSLAPGDYRVRVIEGPLAADGEIELDAGRVTRIASDDLEPIPFRHAIRKGYGQYERVAVSVGLGGEVAGPVLAGTGVVGAGTIGLQVDWAELSFAARARFGGSAGDNGRVAFTQRLVGLDVGLYHVFDVGDHGLGFGVRAGGDWLAQVADGVVSREESDQLVGRVGPFVRGELALGGAFAVTLDVGVDAYVVGVEGELEPRLVPSAALGVAFLP